jgi:hypothetical protein
VKKSKGQSLMFPWVKVREKRRNSSSKSTSKALAGLFYKTVTCQRVSSQSSSRSLKVCNLKQALWLKALFQQLIMKWTKKM